MKLASLVETCMILTSLLAAGCAAYLGLRSAASHGSWGRRGGVTAAVLAGLLACGVLFLLVDFTALGAAGLAFYVTAKWALVLVLLCSAPLVPALLYLGVRWASTRRRLPAVAALAWVTASASACVLVLRGMHT